MRNSRKLNVIIASLGIVMIGFSQYMENRANSNSNIVFYTGVTLIILAGLLFIRNGALMKRKGG